MHKIQIVAVHGFLGSADDWVNIEKDLQTKLSKFLQQSIEIQWLKINLFNQSDDQIVADDLFSFHYLADKIRNLSDPNKVKIFIGYSLGGRIGLHLLEKYSFDFAHFIFLSTHPGLTAHDEKRHRFSHDQQWLRLLQQLTFAEFIKEWSQQPVFKNDTAMVQNSSNLNLVKLEYGLRELSLANQDNMEMHIQKNHARVSWLVGEKDFKFLQIAENLKQKKILSHYERISDSGHRILFDQPSQIASLLLSIILQLQQSPQN